MKKLIVILGILVSTLAKANGLPSSMPIVCKLGQQTLQTVLRDCGHSVAQVPVYRTVNGLPVPTGEFRASPNGEIDEYWCKGVISEEFTVRVTGWLGSSGVVTRIYFLPGKFNGLSPIEIDGTEVRCDLNYREN